MAPEPHCWERMCFWAERQQLNHRHDHWSGGATGMPDPQPSALTNAVLPCQSFLSNPPCQRSNIPFLWSPPGLPLFPHPQEKKIFPFLFYSNIHASVKQLLHCITCFKSGSSSRRWTLWEEGGGRCFITLYVSKSSTSICQIAKVGRHTLPAFQTPGPGECTHPERWVGLAHSPDQQF